MLNREINVGVNMYVIVMLALVGFGAGMVWAGFEDPTVSLLPGAFVLTCCALGARGELRKRRKATQED